VAEVSVFELATSYALKFRFGRCFSISPGFLSAELRISEAILI